MKPAVYPLLSQEQCQQARMTRDARFDGCFYIAVKSTHIFCRPICPANLPKEENVTYYFDKAQAIEAGYRPCLRCRPDSAPGSWAWKGVETTFSRALALIDQGALQSQSLAQLAERLGVSDRYVRQLFQTYLGLSPKQYAQYHQLMFAKQLLHSSCLTITDIGYAAGFNSTRRFNDAFQKYLKLTPSQVRRDKRAEFSSPKIELGYRGTLNWQHMLAFYRRRAIANVELVEDNSYSRRVTLPHGVAWFKVSCDSKEKLWLEYDISDPKDLRLLVSQVRRMLDLDADTDLIEAHLNRIAPGVTSEVGLRIPGVWSAWEAGVRAILGQQVSVTAAINQLNLLVSQANQAQSRSENQWLFPTPELIKSLDLSFLRMPNARKETLGRFACFIAEHPDASPEAWLELKGIGPWTVNYAQLRGLSNPNSFLSGDLVVKKALHRFPTLHAQSASPWGSYATFHLWNQDL